MPILISIGYGVPRSTGRHTNLHTNYDLLVILLVKKMDDDNACGNSMWALCHGFPTMVFIEERGKAPASRLATQRTGTWEYCTIYITLI